MVGGSRRWRAGDGAGAGCMDAAPARDHGARAGSDDTAPIPAAWRCAVAAGRGVHHRGRQARAATSGPGYCRRGGSRARAAEVLDSSAPLTSSVRCAPQHPFNLLAAMALWAGLRIGHGELHAELPLVLAAWPATRFGLASRADGRVHQRGRAGRARDGVLGPLPQPLQRLSVAERDGGLQPDAGPHLGQVQHRIDQGGPEAAAGLPCDGGLVTGVPAPPGAHRCGAGGGRI